MIFVLSMVGCVVFAYVFGVGTGYALATGERWAWNRAERWARRMKEMIDNDTEPTEG